MSHFGVVEDTLFVPMLGRIYASEYCPQILYDPKALELKKKLPSSLPEQDGQSQYTLLASAARIKQELTLLLPGLVLMSWSAGRTV
jgi:O-methyltransferase involved in polyketide biosynthesis